MDGEQRLWPRYWSSEGMNEVQIYQGQLSRGKGKVPHKSDDVTNRNLESLAFP